MKMKVGSDHHPLWALHHLIYHLLPLLLRQVMTADGVPKLVSIVVVTVGTTEIGIVIVIATATATVTVTVIVIAIVTETENEVVVRIGVIEIVGIFETAMLVKPRIVAIHFLASVLDLGMTITDKLMEDLVEGVVAACE